MIRMILIACALLLGGHAFAESAPRGAVVIPGYGEGDGSIRAVADALRDQGFLVRIPKMSQGSETTCSDYVEAARSEYEKLARESNDILIVGTSLGAEVAALMLPGLSRQPNSIVMHAPANYLDEMCQRPITLVIDGQDAHDRLVEWRGKVLSPDATASLRAIHEFDGRLLIVSSEFDTSVPMQTSKNYSAAGKHAEMKVLPGAQHWLTNQQQRELAQMILIWLRPQLAAVIE